MRWSRTCGLPNKAAQASLTGSHWLELPWPESVQTATWVVLSMQMTWIRAGANAREVSVSSDRTNATRETTRRRSPSKTEGPLGPILQPSESISAAGWILFRVAIATSLKRSQPVKAPDVPSAASVLRAAVSASCGVSYGLPGIPTKTQRPLAPRYKRVSYGESKWISSVWIHFLSGTGVTTTCHQWASHATRRYSCTDLQ